MKIALNRITMPHTSLADFLGAAKKMGFDAVEVRNDLPGGQILDGKNPIEVKKLCAETGVRIITINALQRFNDRREFLEARVAELKDLVAIAKDAGIDAVVLCPVNDKDESRSAEQRMSDTVAALKAYAPVFTEAGVKGYLEPLGFEQCSLRFKKDAVTAIERSGCSACYKVVHDTFHHYLSGEKELFPQMTGLIHMSGVLPGKAVADITDDDRILVTDQDIMGNKVQVDALVVGGYNGYCAYECFSPEVQELEASTLTQEVKDSLALMFAH
jgi:2-keto-myo-inositol isomerase